eukprot:11901503-Ditylum_brightwellii.AAC.1
MTLLTLSSIPSSHPSIALSWMSCSMLSSHPNSMPSLMSSLLLPSKASSMPSSMPSSAHLSQATCHL